MKHSCSVCGYVHDYPEVAEAHKPIAVEEGEHASSFHKMCKDEALQAMAFKGLLDRYFA